MARFFCSILLIVALACSCAESTAPNVEAHQTIPPKPTIYVRTPNGGLVPEQRSVVDPRDGQHYGAADLYSFDGTRWRSGEGLPEAVRLRYYRPVGKGPPRTDASRRAGTEPIYPKTYYVRPEHTSTGYIEGRYGRTGDFTPGEHTSREYIRGDYRGDGTYTRPEHTPSGHIPGHYRAVPQTGNPASRIGVNKP